MFIPVLIMLAIIEGVKDAEREAAKKKSTNQILKDKATIAYLRSKI